MSAKFDQAYQKIAISKNYIEPNYPRLDNWAISSYRVGDWFAAMSDGGYTRWIGKRGPDGKVLWRVSEYYPKPLEYSGITEEDFLNELDQLLS
jgi:hypothetical protein